VIYIRGFFVYIQAMRSDIHNARSHVLLKLHDTPGIVGLKHDHSDFVLVDLWTGEKVIFYLVDSYISLHELQKTLARHTANGWHTLFIFWADMLLPYDGERFLPQDWMQALLPLYKDCIYGFDYYSNREVYVFPVHFQPIPGSQHCLIRHGDTITFERLFCHTISTDFAVLKGTWLISDFVSADAEHLPPRDPAQPIIRSALQVYYEALHLQPDADEAAIKSAYRQLARQYHPDLNPAPEALQRMQTINEAYARLMQQFNPAD
jgi:hypothetical protein